MTGWAPGLIVSCWPALRIPVPVTLTVTLCPAAREPDVCERLTPPSSPDGAEMDQLTGPPFAVRVIEPLCPTTSARLCVETLSVPAAGAGAGEPPPEDPGDPDDEEDPEDGADEPDDWEPDVVATLPPPPAVEPDDDTASADPPDAGSAEGLEAAPAAFACAATSGLACFPCGL